jgi:PIN domain nuclease of toxin-antitoxin system
MNEIILDTITFDYLTRNQKALTPKAFQSIQNADAVYLCITSLWELSNHVREGQIPLKSPFESFYQMALNQLGVILLDTQWSALNYLAKFDYQIIEKPWEREENEVIIKGIKRELHKDPFDRMILAHAISMNLPIVSPDTFFPSYQNLGLQVIW